MQQSGRLQGIISIVLVIAMLFAAASVLSGAGFSAPNNPLPKRAEPLLPEALKGGGNIIGNTEGSGMAAPTHEPETTAPSESTEPPTEPQESTPPTEAESTEPTESSTTAAPESTEPTEPSETTEAPKPTQLEPIEPTTPTTEPPTLMPPPSEAPTEPQPSEIPRPTVPTEEALSPTAEPTDGFDPMPTEPADDTVSIVTDLRSQQLTQSELPDGVLSFYAYPSKAEGGYDIRAVIHHANTSVNGQTLTSADELHYKAELPLNETSTITLYLRKNGETVSYVRFQIRFDAEKADEEHPVVGSNPPTIVTNLDDFSGPMETQDFLLWVSARTTPDGHPIYSHQIEVWLNGELIPKQSGDTRPEYELHFQAPNVGDRAEYTVRIVAWDGEGNSAMKQYTFEYHAVDDGDTIGAVTLLLDATTVGLGILDSAEYEIAQGDTAAGAVIRFLEDYGYDAIYDGTATLGFYLRGIERAELCAGAQIPEALWSMILRDGIALSDYSDPDSLNEYDYTMGSGWMYSINGSIYPGRGLSDYPLTDNTTIYLRFTLAYGKDIGGYDATGQGHGELSGYCGVWINGGYTPLSHDYVQTARVEPTQSQDGFVEYTCTRCGDIMREALPYVPPEAVTLPPRNKRLFSEDEKNEEIP